MFDNYTLLWSIFSAVFGGLISGTVLFFKYVFKLEKLHIENDNDKKVIIKDIESLKIKMENNDRSYKEADERLYKELEIIKNKNEKDFELIKSKIDSEMKEIRNEYKFTNESIHAIHISLEKLTTKVETTMSYIKNDKATEETIKFIRSSNGLDNDKIK